MNKTMQKELLFSAAMTLGMVVIMLTYNTILRFGLSGETPGMLLAHFVPIYIGAFLIQKLIVDHNVKKAHKMIVAPEDKAFKKTIVYTLLMVTMMVLFMTLYASLLSNTGSQTFWGDYIKSVLMNYPVALMAQLVVVGPLVRAMFSGK